MPQHIMKKDPIEAGWYWYYPPDRFVKGGAEAPLTVLVKFGRGGPKASGNQEEGWPKEETWIETESMPGNWIGPIPKPAHQDIDFSEVEETEA